MGLFPHKLTSLFETLEEPWSLTSSLWLAVEETKERKRLSAKSVSRSFCSTFPGSVCHGTQLILPPLPPPLPPITCHSQICWERLSAQPKCDSGGSTRNPSACTKACCLTAGHGNEHRAILSPLVSWVHLLCTVSTCLAWESVDRHI